MSSKTLSVIPKASFTVTLCFIFNLIFIIDSNAASLYKWVDKDGQIRYSDTLPSQQSSKTFQTLATDGRVLSTKEASKSPEELRTERRKQKRLEEEQRIQAEIKQRMEATQQHHDNVLLMTFTNEKEILAAQDERLAVIDSVINLLNKNVKTEQVKLQNEEKIAQKLYLDRNQPIPGGQAQKIEYFTEKVLSKQQHLSLKLEEREKVKQQYINDLIRFRELKDMKKKESMQQENKARLKNQILDD